MLVWQPSVPCNKQSSSTHPLATPLSCQALIGCSAQHRCNQSLSLSPSHYFSTLDLQLFIPLLTHYKTE